MQVSLYLSCSLFWLMNHKGVFLLVLGVEDTRSRPGPDPQKLERRDTIEPAASDLFASLILLVSITRLCTASVLLLEGQMSSEAIEGVAAQIARQDGD